MPVHHIIIIGGGVTGLTTACELLQRNYKVTVIAERYANEENRITSQIAGALWEWPPAVCGRHTNTMSLKKSKRWCKVAYDKFKEMAADPELSEAAGVKMRLTKFFFTEPVISSYQQTRKMHEIKENVDGFRHSVDIITESGVNSSYSPAVVDAYEHFAPVIDTDKYMSWIRDEALSLGATLLTERIRGSLRDSEPALLARFSATAIINCTGLAAAELAKDYTCRPLRGALVRVINDGSKFPRITSAMAISLDGREGKQDMVFIVPRNDCTVILGGLVEPDQWDLNINLENYPPIKAMYDRCVSFYEPLGQSQIDSEYPVAVGLRPFRDTNVRVEREPINGEGGGRSKIIHSYGHGGSGFSLSFGCAVEVANIVDEIVGEIETDERVMARM